MSRRTTSVVAMVLAIWLGAAWAVCLCRGAVPATAHAVAQSCCGSADDPVDPSPLEQPCPERCPHCSMGVLPAMVDAVPTACVGPTEATLKAALPVPMRLTGLPTAPVDSPTRSSSPPVDARFRLSCWCVLTL